MARVYSRVEIVRSQKVEFNIMIPQCQGSERII